MARRLGGPRIIETSGGEPVGIRAVLVDGSGNVQSGALTDAQLRATPVPVSGTVTATGPLTDAQLRASPVPISGTVTASGALTDTELRASPVPVSGTVTASGPLTDAQLRASPVPVSSSGTTPVSAAKFNSHLLGADGTVNDAIADCNLAGAFADPNEKIVYRTFATGGKVTGIGFILTISSGTIAQIGWGTAVTGLSTGICIELVASNPTDPDQAAIATFPSSRIRAVADLTANGWREATDRAATTSIVLFHDLSMDPIDVPTGYSVRAVARESTNVNSVDRVNIALRYIED